MRYEVTVVIDASCSATVEADSPEEAADKAMEEHGFPSICHQCACQLNVGDAVGAVVYDSECETQLLDTTYQAERIAELEAEIARLRAAPTPPAQAQAGAVPLTVEQVKAILLEAGYGSYNAPVPERAAFISGLRHSERAHGIKGKEAGNA